jgi:succinylglutamic semialdehyde dehydrogenase
MAGPAELLVDGAHQHVPAFRFNGAVMKASLFIDGQWQQGHGAALDSSNPGTSQSIWSGHCASSADVDLAANAARAAFESWSALEFSEREGIARKFAQFLERDRERLADAIGQETGKPLWETRIEVTTMIGKIDISVRAYHQRSGSSETETAGVTNILRHRPHGVVGVFGPYNFPGHLPNGHIVPALLAGNCVLFKPSEQAPWVAEETVKLWQEAGIPAGVLNLLQGERATGEAISQHAELDGLYFTGSARTGDILSRQFAGQPGKILALEMGGNNPLIVGSVSDDMAALYDVLQSAYLSSGQRCTCARRLYVQSGPAGDDFIAKLVRAVQRIKVGPYNDAEQPFMGCVISAQSAQQLLSAQSRLIDLGAIPLAEMKPLALGPAFLSPGLLDVTPVRPLPDEEYFGPLLQLIRYDTLSEAITMANQTRYGLSAGLLSEREEDWALFYKKIRAGIVNWNRPTTGASSAAPFGGIGASGNHRASAFYAADYCAYPVASTAASRSSVPDQPVPGTGF